MLLKQAPYGSAAKVELYGRHKSVFDPRSDIIGLFTSSRIGAASRFSTTSVYVKLLSYEDNDTAEPNDYGSKYVGIIWLKPPRAYLDSLDVGFRTTEHEVVVDCDLVIPKNNEWLRNSHATFINSVLHTFETTVRTNCSAAGKSWGTAEVKSIPISLDPDNPNIYRRVMELICIKAN